MESRIKTLSAALATVCMAAAPPARAQAADVPGASTVDVVIAATTDVHGRIRAWDYFADTAEATRGLARAATVIDSARAANPGRLILVDAGDFLQGNALTFAAARIDTMRPNAVILAMNAMHYAAVVLGNHEFNDGVPALTRALGAAQFPVLAANVSGGIAEKLWRPFTIVEVRGVKIGIVGATTQGSMVWDAANLRAAHMTVTPIIPAIREAVAAARAAGAAAIVVVAHAGLSGPSTYDTLAANVGAEHPMAAVAREVPGIDLIVFGHSHREVADTVINGVLLTQPRNWATSVSLAHLLLERSGGMWRVASKHSSLVQAAGHAESPAVVKAVERGHASARAYAAQVLGSTSVSWSSDSARLADIPIMDFVSETMRRVGHADLGAVSAFSTDVRVAAGPVTVARLAQLYPYENTLRVLRITGKQLRAFLERTASFYEVNGGRISQNPAMFGYDFDALSGAEYVLDLTKPAGSRVTELSYHGKPVRETDSFTLAVSNYRAEGGGGYTMLRGSPVVLDKQQDIRQLLIDEVSRRGTLNPEDYFTKNWSFRFPRATTIRIITTNDFHGALDAKPDGNFGLRGGAAQVAAMIRRAESECTESCASILLDAGDEWQGTPASNLAYGWPVTDFFNAIGLAASAIGNHDFDWGTDTLRARMRQAHYAMLAANVHYTDGKDVPWIRQDTIVERGGVRIGIVGIATPVTPSNTKRENVAGLRFDDPVATVNAHAKSLRARGADLVVVVEHDGAFCDRGPDKKTCSGLIIDLAQRVTERVDAIVSGHTHSTVATEVKGIPVVQAMSSGRAIGVIDLPVDLADRAREHESVRIVNTDSITPDPQIAALLRDATQRVASLVARPVATVAEDMLRRGDQFALGNLVADSQRAAAHADIAFMNNGGIRSDLRAGPVSYGGLFEVQPFGNMLVRETVHGKDLKAYLESFFARGAPRFHVSGAVIRYDMDKPAGSRIVSATIGGAPLDDTRVYAVAFTDFMSTSGEGLTLTNASLTHDTIGTDDLDALITFVQAMPGGVIKGDATPRVVPVAK